MTCCLGVCCVKAFRNSDGQNSSLLSPMLGKISRLVWLLDRTTVPFTMAAPLIGLSFVFAKKNLAERGAFQVAVPLNARSHYDSALE